VPLTAEFIGIDVPKTARIYWQDIKQYSTIAVTYRLYENQTLVFEDTITLKNVKTYRLTAPLYVQLE